MFGYSEKSEGSVSTVHVAGDRGRSEEDVEGKQSIGEDRVRNELLKTTELRVCL